MLRYTNLPTYRMFRLIFLIAVAFFFVLRPTSSLFFLYFILFILFYVPSQMKKRQRMIRKVVGLRVNALNFYRFDRYSILFLRVFLHYLALHFQLITV